MARTSRTVSPPVHPPERADRDRALFERYLDRRDPVDRDMLVERFLPLARQLARRYQRPEEPFDDLFQVACLGLVKAIDRFDLSRDVAFSSYAVPTILGEIKRYFRDRTWSVRVPRDLQELALRVDRKVTELSTDLHRQPTVDELAAVLGLESEQVLEALEASGAYRATSLSLPRNGEDEGGETLGDSVGMFEDGFALAEDRATLARLLQTVSPREREVLRVDRKVTELSTDLHRQPTVDEIAAVLGLDAEQVLEALEASGAYRATSLSTPRGNDDDAGETLGDTVGTSEEGFGLAEDRATLEQLMRAVTPREREVLRLRFEEDLTQAEIGEVIGVSQMQVSRIIRQSINRLRTVAQGGGT